MDVSETYIKRCEEVAKELWDNLSDDSKFGTIIAWRSFLGILIPTTPKPLEGLIAVMPEALALRTWGVKDEASHTLISDIRITKTNVRYSGLDADKGTPLFRQDQLQEMVRGNGDLVMDFLQDFMDWATNAPHTINSMEQLWLAFVKEVI